MSRRLLELIGLAAAITIGVVLLQLTPARLAAQAPTARATPGTPPKADPAPKTAWGEPDLQGIWTSNFQVPLERSDQNANKEFYTDAEIAEIDKRRASGPGLGVGDRRAKRGTEQDVSGAYNSVYQSQRPTGRRTAMIVDPPDGRIPETTPEAKKWRAMVLEFENALLQATDICRKKLVGCSGGTYGPVSPRRLETPPYYVATSARGGTSGAINRADGPEDRNLGERCLSFGLPDFGGFRQIVQSPGSVSIYYDVGQGQGWERIVPVTDRPHVPSSIRQWWGDSRGRWEGNALVVDVTNFSPKKDYQGSRENLHLIERWTRIDADTLEYVVTVEDATAWTRPWTAKQELNRQSDQANRFYHEPRCHEGNYGMAALLVGGRADERAFAEGRGPDPATMCTAGCGTNSGEEQ